MLGILVAILVGLATGLFSKSNFEKGNFQVVPTGKLKNKTIHTFFRKTINPEFLYIELQLLRKEN